MINYYFPYFVCKSIDDSTKFITVNNISHFLCVDIIVNCQGRCMPKLMEKIEISTIIMIIGFLSI